MQLMEKLEEMLLLENNFCSFGIYARDWENRRSSSVKFICRSE